MIALDFSAVLAEWPLLAKGAGMTVLLTAVSSVAGLAIGVGGAWARWQGPRWLALTVGFLVQVVKGTALASVIGFIELTKAGTMISNATFRPFTVYACVALMYFVLCFPISAWSRGLERRLHAHR